MGVFILNIVRKEDIISRLDRTFLAVKVGIVLLIVVGCLVIVGIVIGGLSLSDNDDSSQSSNEYDRNGQRERQTTTREFIL